MRFDTLLTPISAAEPCGPDLDEVGDDDYLNYMLGADNKIPERYLDTETGAPFDRSKIDLNAETRAISGFLEQTRDLRLLTLEARFQALGGQMLGFCDSVQTIAQVTAEFWDTVHPQASDGDYTMRQNSVGVLDDRKTVVLPLQYAPILWDQRAGAISLRDHAVATGTAVALEAERKLDINQIHQILRSESNRAAVDAAHAALSGCKAAFRSLQTLFDEKTDYQYSPSFELVTGVLDQLLKFIESGREDLRPTAPAAADQPPGNGSATGAQTDDGSSPPAVAAAGAFSVTTQAGAAAALLAAESYFGRYEPSSPALILVHQSRLLVGKPLVTAIEALMPDYAEYAAMIVDAGVGFQFGMAKMREITENYASVAGEVEGGGEPLPDYAAETRQAALGLLSATAAFFRTAEPSSPIPMLLTQAERLASQSFHAIISELLPKKSA